jgi:hypothetical protein
MGCGKEGHLMSSTSRARRRFGAASTAFAAAAALMIAAAVPAAAVDYPAPGGIYTPFTDCPLTNPLMAQSVGGDATGCIASISNSGTFTIHGIPVSVTHPVKVQFGVWDPPNATPNQFSGGVLAPPDGKWLVASPENTPGGLFALLCPSSTPAVALLCRNATATGHTGLTAQIQSAGPITNFDLVSFTQPVKIKLINPILGGNCYIGSNSHPIVLNPTITTGTLTSTPDPNPTRFPTTAVLAITANTVTDDTFSVPAATGCGPGGVADGAINGRLGLPSASGNNHLVLHGNSYFADDFSPANQAADLRAAFLASTGT